MPILKRGDVGYEQAVATWNGAVTSDPDEVMLCKSVQDVQRALARSQQFNTPIAIKAGGHSAAGFSSIQGGTLLCLRGLNAVTIDPEKKTVTAGGGALWGEVDEATQRHHLATPGCFISSVGVAGPLQSGGVSRLIRRYGLIADQLLEARIILADGSLVTASEQEHADLFWALRGGAGNFGVITQMLLQLHPINEVQTVTLIFSEEQASPVLHELFLRTQGAPRTLSWQAILASPSSGPFPKELWGHSVLVLSLACCDRTDAMGQKMLRALATIGKPSVKKEEVVAYSVLQKSTDEIAPAGKHWFMRSEWLRDLDDAAIQAMIGTMMDRINHATSSDNQIILHQVDGAMADVSADASPFSFRNAHYFAEIIGGTDTTRDTDEQLAWCHETWRSLTPWSAATRNGDGTTTASHLAHLGIGEGTERVQGAFGHRTWQRLRHIKSQYDPTNMFSHGPTIPPLEKEGA